MDYDANNPPASTSVGTRRIRIRAPGVRDQPILFVVRARFRAQRGGCETVKFKGRQNTEAYTYTSARRGGSSEAIATTKLREPLLRTNAAQTQAPYLLCNASIAEL